MQTFLPRWPLMLVLLLGTIAARTQQPSQVQTSNATRAPVPTGSVTGTVICSDTQRPARFVQVMLEPVSASDNRSRGIGAGGGGNSRTGVDGVFSMPQVGIGDYYVLASAPGYVSARALAQAAANAGQDPNEVLSNAPVVHVTAQSAVNVTVRMQRGAAISGRVQWEDGSPASGVMMTAVPVAKPVPLPSTITNLRSVGGQQVVTTDDRGYFRILGLATGDYYVMGTIDPRSGVYTRGGSTIHIYSPKAFRKADATPVSVKEGDDRSDVLMVIDVTGLHTVSGRVTASDPNQTVASGTVSITDPNNTDLNLSAQIAPDGSFTVHFVPAGTYNLSVPSAWSAEQFATPAYSRPDGVPRPGGFLRPPTSVFQPLNMSLTVGDTDVSGLNLALAPSANQQSSANH